MCLCVSKKVIQGIADLSVFHQFILFNYLLHIEFRQIELRPTGNTKTT